MRKLVAVPMVLWCAVSALGQGGQVVPFCASNLGALTRPDGVPCFDPALGVIVPFGPTLPTQKLPPLPTPDTPVVITEGQLPKLTLPAVSDESEYWSYKPDGTAVYHDGDYVQQFDGATVQSYASNYERFQQSYEVGAAGGALITALVVAWDRHHQKMVAVKNNSLREQFSAYDDAGCRLVREVLQDADTMITDFALLAELDPAEKDDWEGGVKDASVLRAHIAEQLANDAEMHTKILASNHEKYLEKSVATAKERYKYDLNWVKEVGVWTRIVGASVGFYEYQQKAHSTPAEITAPPTH